MAKQVSVVIERDEDGYYAWCPELKGCQSEGKTLEEVQAGIREAVELCWEAMTVGEREEAGSREILVCSVMVGG